MIIIFRAQYQINEVNARWNNIYKLKYIFSQAIIQCMKIVNSYYFEMLLKRLKHIYLVNNFF